MTDDQRMAMEQAEQELTDARRALILADEVCKAAMIARSAASEVYLAMSQRATALQLSILREAKVRV
jgi:hypothetical protein